MSKCEIKIAFDRPDRIYRGGESVRGTVKISVNETVNSKGVKLSHRWKTHGRGNVDSGPEEIIVLSQSKLLMAGEEFEFPFELKTAPYPVSYHGQLISIDHYVRVDVDVPWARNPFAEEDYILRPGAVPPEMTGDRGSKVALKAAPAKLGMIATVFLSLFGVIFLTFIAAFAFFLLPVILAVVAFFWIRKTAVAARVGTVEVSMPHIIVAPGEDWPFEISFTPRKTFQVKSITLKIVATETTVSGSGSDRKTSTHELLAKSIPLRESSLLVAGELVNEKQLVKFPGLNAYSFDASDNKITWNAEVRIDIPRFPDWSKSEELQVVPAEFFGGESNPSRAAIGDFGDEGVDDDDEDKDISSTSEDDRDFERASDTDTESIDEDAHPPATSFARPATIGELVTQLESVGRHSTQRNEIIANAASKTYEVAVLIDRIVSSMGTMNFGERFANGKTVIGSIQNTNQAIQILASESENSELESFRRGDVWDTQIEITSWDTLYNRINGQTLE